MKLLSITFFFTILTSFVFSQEQKKELSEAEKQQLRNQFEQDLRFSTTKKKSSNQKLNVTSSSEENSKDIPMTTTVKYYYGKKDTLFKDFDYTK